MIISSVNNKLIKDTAKLNQKKYRDKESLFLAEGYNLFEEAKKANIVKHVFTVNNKINGENIIYVTNEIMAKLTNSVSPQEIITVCHKRLNEDVKDKVLLLDNIQDPGNLGTLLRSALAFGFETVVLDNTVDIFSPKVIRSTQGAIFQLNIIFSDILDFIYNFKDIKYYGTSFNGTLLTNIEKVNKIGVVLGNEGNGVKKEILESLDENITIKINKIESLNVAVAGSVIMHYFSN
ncbi:RNA methyltransferase [Candidatus Izimaplasma sp. ZiA1]|uniref:TrmH family RNA methyltransferase n=1 Tax=Candidatus Izimoplasma sp. ZiA1 TaxID=2024899 RepID=UPI00143972ED